MFELILLILGCYLLYKWSKASCERGKNYFAEIAEKEYVSTKIPKVVEVPLLTAFKDYQATSPFKDSFGVFDCVTGGVKYFVSNKGETLMHGNFYDIGTQFVVCPGTIVHADIPHKDELKYSDGHGTYVAITDRWNDGTIRPLGNYFLYKPEICPICGKPIGKVYRKANLLYTSTLETSVALDSHERYCKDCNEILNNDREIESYYSFFIDTIEHKMIKSVDKDKFSKYMQDVKSAKEVDTMPIPLENWIDSKTYDLPLQRSMLSEYTKNVGSCEMWERVKVCA